MPLDARDAFKVGFLARCAEEGLSGDQIAGRVKAAGDKFASLLSGLGSAAGSALSTGIPLALAAPIVLGGAAGYGLSRATDIDDTDVAEIKGNELLDTYAAETAKLRRQRAVREFRAAQKTPRQFGV